MRKFLITNLCNMYNMGEVLQLRALKQEMPEDEFTIQSLYSFIDTHLCKTMDIRYDGSTKPPMLPKIVLTVIKLVVKALVDNIYSSYDAVIDLGGDTFSDKPSLRYTVMHCLTLLPFAIARKPYIVCSQSIGPFGITRPLAKFILKRAARITVRESTTQKYLSQLGIKSEVHPDLAYIVQASMSPKRDSLVGVNPSAIIHSRMGVSFDEYVNMITDLTDKLQRNRDVLLIPHVYGPRRGLGSVSNVDDKEVIGRVKHKAGTHEDIDKCGLFIGFRMHACIRAISLGIPTVAIGYSHKTGSLPAFNWIRTLHANTLTVHDILNCAAELNGAIIDRTELDKFKAATRGHIDAINEACHLYTKRLLGPHIKCYTGSSEKFRWGAASGGTAKALAVCNRQAVLTLEPNRLDPQVVICEASRMPQGSIYSFGAVASKMCAMYNTEMTVIGTPCQIGAVKKLHPDAFCIGLFCAHKIEREGMVLLLKHLRLAGDKVEYRAKKNGRTGMLVDDKTFVPLSTYWRMFFNYSYIPEQCLQCNDHTNEAADISLGDAWYIKPNANVIVARTEQGEALIQKAVNNGLLYVEEVNPQSVIRTQNYLPVKKNVTSLRVCVYKLLRSMGNYTSHRLLLRPILRLWLRTIVRNR